MAATEIFTATPECHGLSTRQQLGGTHCSELHPDRVVHDFLVHFGLPALLFVVLLLLLLLLVLLLILVVLTQAFVEQLAALEELLAEFWVVCI